MIVVVAVGSCGWNAHTHVVEARAKLPSCIDVMAVSRRYLNPPWGETTKLPFVNLCMVLRSPWPMSTLLRALHAIERSQGRVRHPFLPSNGARTLDIDVIASLPSGAGRWSWLPHPRAEHRPFVVVPMVEALRAAGVPVPWKWLRAHRAMGLERVQPQPP
jgi:2-amino-4-hydroxy-6-hydroxymethyldihydropteridine diphosphokinase